jgi:hypothetical protein
VDELTAGQGKFGHEVLRLLNFVFGKCASATKCARERNAYGEELLHKRGRVTKTIF